MAERKKIRLWFLFFMLVLLIIGCFKTKSSDQNKVNEIIEQVKLKYCPDKRISVFEINPRFEKNKVILKGEVLSLEAKHELTSRLQTEVRRQLEDSLVLLPDKKLRYNFFGVVRVSVAQAHKKPDESSEIVTQEIMGAEVRLLKKKSYWYYCQFDDNYLGWLMESAVVSGDKDFIDRWREKKKLVVTANYGQIWEKPFDDDTLPVSDVVLGNKFVELGRERNWIQLQLPDGREGYIEAKLVMDEEKFNNQKIVTPENLVRRAYSFLGIPYFWGGKSTKGFDCSGFTQTVYKLNGIQLPRDANMQVKAGKHISLDDNLKNLQTGDLVFFGKDIDHIFHVGMYLFDGKFIHSDGMVHIDSFNPEEKNYNDYRRKGLQAARRILPN